VRLAILTSVFRRDRFIFEPTIRRARRAFPDATICIWADDKHPDKYVENLAYETHSKLEAGSALDAIPDAYHINGHKDPSWAMNRCFDMAKKYDPTHLLLLGSDVIVSPLFLEAWKSFDPDEMLWTPRVVDLDTSAVYCSTQRIWPMNWSLLCRREWFEDCGGFDENFMRGIAFEDNDLTGRMLQKAGFIMFDDRVTAWHQSHDQTAYSDNMVGFNINKAYIEQKWQSDCAPFNSHDKPLAIECKGTHGPMAVWGIRDAEPVR
jgi:hypothetical protein